MEIHKPKPFHGVREFLKEYGIIVLGVLTALALEQVVEAIHRRSEVEQLRGALRGELADDRARWEHMRAQDGCTKQRLDALDKWVATAPLGAKLRSDSYRVFLWGMHSSAWDIAKTSAVAADIPLKERLTYASLHAAIENWRQFIDEENANIGRLGGLLATADQPENRRQIRFHLERARVLLGRRENNYIYFFTRFDELGIKPDYSQLTIRADPSVLCEPLSKEIA
jgi:hypothetical protein